MVKHTQTIRRQKSTNCFSMFDHFVGLALKGLNHGIILFGENNNKLNQKYFWEKWDLLNVDQINDLTP